MLPNPKKGCDLSMLSRFFDLNGFTLPMNLKLKSSEVINVLDLRITTFFWFGICEVQKYTSRLIASKPLTRSDVVFLVKPNEIREKTLFGFSKVA